MKIRELLREFDPSSVDIGKDVGQDLKKGSNFVKRLTNPSQWLGGSDSTEKKFASNLEMRDSLVAAASGRYYEDDVKVLKQILAGIQDGSYKTANPKMTGQNLKTVINGGQVSKQGAADLVALSKTFD